MLTADVMNEEVISISPSARIDEAIQLMTSKSISGLPVIDYNGTLVGIVTEGDFLRRAELGTEKRRPRWIEFLAGSNAVAADYIQTHSRRVGDVMTKSVVTIEEDTPLDEVVRLMEKKRVKRLPVLRGKLVVGIVSRANLVRALAALSPPRTRNASDAEIRERVSSEIERHLGSMGRYNIIVKDGVVDLWGTIFGNSDAVRVAAENVPGVKAVRNHLVWVDPLSGMMIETLPHDDHPKVG